jgi:membrane protein YdbS with pleckstrin-like domain
MANDRPGKTMNQHQRAGLRAVWEIYRLLLVVFAIAAMYFGVGALVNWITGSAAWTTATMMVLVLGSFYGYLTWDAYRRGVESSKSKAEHEANMAELERMRSR